MADTIWDRLEECVQHLSEPFRASEMVGWFRRHYPDVKEQSLRAHIQGATSNASVESRGMFANRHPLITRIEHGVYRRFDGDPEFIKPNQIATRDRVMTRRAREVDIEATVGRYLRDRGPSARYTSFDYCFNHFQQHRTEVAAWGEPTGMEASCLQLGFYLASWGMLRGSSDLLQRSARHLIPLIETLAEAPAEVWDGPSSRSPPGRADDGDSVVRNAPNLRPLLDGLSCVESAHPSRWPLQAGFLRLQAVRALPTRCWSNRVPNRSTRTRR